MKFWRKNDGLTLVELIVSMAIGTMIFAATTTVLLLGFRIHARTTESVTQQYTARMVITMLEQMAGDGSFDKTYRSPDGSWKLGLKAPGDNGGTEFESVFSSVLLSYSSEKQAIFSGDFGNVTTAEPILENVVASYIILKDNVVTISLEDENGTYTSSVYCRTVAVKGGKNFESAPSESIVGSTGGDDSEERERFLLLLNSQVGSYGGIINQDARTKVESTYCDKGCNSFNLFSQWYIGGYDGKPGWNAETPWCGCFVSWGLSHIDSLEKQGTNDRWFANVDDFMAYFTKNANKATCWKEAGKTPVPGDLIFFNMISDERDNPSHMGVVLSVNTTKKIVTTIEGNSADMVAVREYPLTDSRILGYGDPWAAQITPQGGS